MLFPMPLEVYKLHDSQTAAVMTVVAGILFEVYKFT